MRVGQNEALGGVRGEVTVGVKKSRRGMAVARNGFGDGDCDGTVCPGECP